MTVAKAKAVSWGIVILAASCSPARADNISASNGSWTFFGNAATLQTQYPNLFNIASSVSSPAPAPAPVTPPAAAPATFSFPTQSTPAPTPTTANGFINFGSASSTDIAALTVGTESPWYTSPSVTKFFGGGTPDAAQQSAFENQVLQDVQHTFGLAGMNPTLTISPNTPALHSISVESGLSYGPNANAIGITNVGGNGFGFIDKLSYATSLSDLEWAVAHNVSHELMHAFGIGYHPDQTGSYIDAASASWSLLTNPNTTFSPLAAQVITATGFGVNTGAPSQSSGLEKIDGDQEILASPVPEPATYALWTFALAGLALHGRCRQAPRA